MVVLAFEMALKDGSVLIRLPTYKTQQLGANSKKPSGDTKVLIIRKEEFKGLIFGFDIDKSASTCKFWE